MALRKIFFVVCLMALVFCLAVGYGFAGQWLGVAVAVMTGLAWLLAQKYLTSKLPLLCLLASVCLAVIGVLTGASPGLMIGGSALALAVYDLLLLDIALKSSSAGEQTHRYETQHLQSLALALGSGLLGIFLGRWLRLEVSFFVLVVFVALAVYGLARVWEYIEKMVYR
jgi:uncharacterized membrane protein YjjP (DUF1212 family)